ncbi:hypothetical protein D3C77_524420 [compost metagenome]
MAIQHGELLMRTNLQVLIKLRARTVDQSLQNPIRQNKIVNPAAMLGKFELRGVMRMHFRQQFNFIRIGEFLNPVEELIDVRLHEKATGSQLLNNITDSIQPDNLDVLLLEVCKKLLEKPPGQL